MKRTRLLTLLLEKKLFSDETEARRAIEERRCRVDGVIVLNPKREVSPHADLVVESGSASVSRASEKLRGALDGFCISVCERICADLGCSTGGFTELLLERGAEKVFAVDTARGELAWKLRSDERVVVLEGQNAATLTKFEEPVSLITIDISLVPLRDILPTAWRLLEPGGEVIALVKPQYELSSREVPRGGIVDDEAQQQLAVLGVSECARGLGFEVSGEMKSTRRGKSGNQEYLILLRKPEAGSSALVDSEKLL